MARSYQLRQAIDSLQLKLLFGVAVVALCFAETAVNAQPKLLRVVLLGGQSNADGRAPSSTLPPFLQSPQTNVPLYYYTHGAPTNNDGTLGNLTTLRPGATEKPAGGFGPEVKLGYDLSRVVEEVPGARLAIIKYAKGGSVLATDWKANGNGTPDGDGVHYQVFQRVVHDGLAKLRSAFPNSTVEIAGMVWVQGEQDIDKGSSTAMAYATNLTTFIGDVRQTFCPTMPFCLSRISTQQTFYSVPSKYTDFLTVRSNQLVVATTLPNTYMIDTDGTNFSIMPDRGHFDAEGQQVLGAAFAAQLANILKPRVSETGPNPAGPGRHESPLKTNATRN